MVDYSELIPEQEEELPESWICDSLPVFRVEEECFDSGDSSPLNFD